MTGDDGVITFNNYYILFLHNTLIPYNYSAGTNVNPITEDNVKRLISYFIIVTTEIF